MLYADLRVICSASSTSDNALHLIPFVSNVRFMATQFDRVSEGVLGRIFHQNARSRAGGSRDCGFDPNNLIKLSISEIAARRISDGTLDIDGQWPSADSPLVRKNR
jgi:hypothetical protein